MGILPDIGHICCNITFSKVNYAFNKLDSEKMIIDRQRNFFKVTPDLEICEICETFKMFLPPGCNLLRAGPERDHEDHQGCQDDLVR